MYNDNYSQYKHIILIAIVWEIRENIKEKTTTTNTFIKFVDINKFAL